MGGPGPIADWAAAPNLIGPRGHTRLTLLYSLFASSLKTRTMSWQQSCVELTMLSTRNSARAGARRVVT
jgi:hypothetical protein